MSNNDIYEIIIELRKKDSFPCETCLCRPLCINKKWDTILEECQNLEEHLATILGPLTDENYGKAFLVDVPSLKLIFSVVITYSSSGPKIYFGHLEEGAIMEIKNHLNEFNARSVFRRGFFLKSRFKKLKIEDRQRAFHNLRLMGDTGTHFTSSISLPERIIVFKE